MPSGRPSWLQNAVRSIGGSFSSNVRTISPTLYTITGSGARTATTVASTIMRNRGGIDRISNSFRTNKYIQYGSRGIQNALKQLESGNFYTDGNDLSNTDNLTDGLAESLDKIEESGFTFSDDNADNSLNVNYVNASGNSSYIDNKVNYAISSAASANVAAHEATMNTMIGLASSNMMQTAQIATEINTNLININNNLTALLQYQNENMSKFITASMAYYEKIGSNMDNSPKSGPYNTTKTDLMNTAGGFKFDSYKKYIKKQFENTLDETGLSMISTFLKDDSFIEQFIQNPLSLVTPMVTASLIPTSIKKSLEMTENAFKTFATSTLEKLGDIANKEASSLTDYIGIYIGKIFGVDTNQRSNNSFKNITIARGATPFDGETKFAITEIITKELRQQTSYLNILADAVTGTSTKDRMLKGTQVWDWNKNAYVNYEDITKSITDTLVDSISHAIESTDFGLSLRNLQTSEEVSSNESVKKDVDATIRELYVQMERHQGSISLDNLITLINATNGGPEAKRLISNWVKKMKTDDTLAYGSISQAHVAAQEAFKNTKDDIRNNPTLYHLLDSEYSGTDDIDAVLNSQLANRSHATSERLINNGASVSPEYRKAVRASKVGYSFSENGATSIGKTLSSLAQSGANGSMRMLDAIFTEGPEAVMTEFGNTLIEQVKTIGNATSKYLFGTKIEGTNYKEGGILSSLNNGFFDIVGQFKHALTGASYKDSKGNTIEASDDSIFNSVKSSLTGVFQKGLNGWMDAFFGNTGNEENIDDLRKQQAESLKSKMSEIMPAGIGGAAIGAGVGIASSGSLLGLLVGGPIGGAAIGGALGFLSRNEKFQNYLFGEKDDNGERTGGLISKGVQDWFKTNKDAAIGGGLIGAGVGAITGGGLLGTIVGGPIAGALLGMASTTIRNSKTFQTFLFGDGENRQGIINKVKAGFAKGWTKTGDHSEGESDVDAGKLIGMAGLGAGAGGLLGMVVGGPVFGSLLGLAATVKASSTGFKEFLFGKKDGLTLDDGTKVDKQGLIGQFGNMLNANIIQPMKTEIAYIAKDAMTTIKYDILAPFSDLAGFFAEKAGAFFSDISDGVHNVLSGLTDMMPDFVKNIGDKVVAALGDGLSGVTHLAYESVKTVATAPIKLLKAVAMTMNLGEHLKKIWDMTGGAVVKTAAKGMSTIFKFTTGLIKDTFGILTKPFKLFGSGLLSFLHGFGSTFFGRDENGKAKGLFTKIGDFGRSVKNNYIGLSNEDADTSNAEHAANKRDYELNKKLNKNGKIIYKLTNGQFSEDSVEARAWLQRHNPKGLDKLDSEAFSQQLARKSNIEGGLIGKGGDIGKINGAEFAKLDGASKTAVLVAQLKLLLSDRFKEEDENEEENEEKRHELDEATHENVSKAKSGEYKRQANPDDDMDDTGAKQTDDRLFGNTRDNLKALGSSIKNSILDKLFGEIPPENRRANGGPVKKGESYLVGENNPEIFSPNIDGYIINPNAVEDASDENRRSSNRRMSSIIRDNDSTDKEKEEARDEQARIRIDEMQDRADDAKKDAFDKAMTADEVIAKKKAEEAEQREEEKIQLLRETAESSTENKDINKQFGIDWSKIFSTKGLITGALIGGALLLKNHLPSLITGVGKVFGFLSRIGGAIGKGISWILDMFENANEEGTRTNGNTAAEEAAEIVEEAANGNLITDANGDATSRTDSLVNLIGLGTTKLFTTKTGAVIRAGAELAGKGVQKVGTGIKNGANAVKNYFTKEAAETAGDAVIDGAGKATAEGLKNSGDDVLKAASTSNQKMITSIKNWITGWLDDIAKGITKKFPEAAKAGSKLKTLPNTIKGFAQKIFKGIGNQWNKLCERVTTLTGGRVTAATMTAGLVELGFITLGALDGLSGTAKLFHVSQDNVDGTMRLIATVMGALKGTTVGAIVDVVVSFASSILGTDLMSGIATTIYSVLKANDDEALEKLDSSQHEWHEQYISERTTVLQQQLDTQKAAGMVDQDTTIEEFEEGVLTGTYNATYKSELDWNTEKNGTIYDKLATGVGHMVKGGGNLLYKAKNAIFGGATEYRDKTTGNTYRKDPDGSFSIYDKDGKLIGNKINTSFEDLQNRGIDVEEVKHKGIITRAGESISQFGSNVKNGAVNLYNKASGTVSDFVDQLKAASGALITGIQTIKNNFNNTDMDFDAYISADVNTLDEDNVFKSTLDDVFGVSKTVMFPILAVVGSAKRIANAIPDKITNIFNAISTVYDNCQPQNSALLDLALSGDISGLNSYSSNISDDVPLAGVLNGLFNLTKFTYYPIAWAKNVGTWISDGISNIVSSVSTVYDNCQSQNSALLDLALSGDTGGLASYSSNISDDVPLAGVLNGMFNLAKFTYYPIAWAKNIGTWISDGISNIVSSVSTMGSNVGDQISSIFDLAKSGDISGLASYSSNISDDVPLAGVLNGMVNLTKLGAYPIAWAKNVGTWISDGISGGIDFVSTSVADVKTYIEKLNTYTDPDKSMDDFKNETIGDGTSIVSQVVSPLIRGIMSIYVNIVRSFKSLGKWAEDGITNIKENASTVVDNAKETVSNVKNTIKNGVYDTLDRVKRFATGGNGYGTSANISSILSSLNNSSNNGGITYNIYNPTYNTYNTGATTSVSGYEDIYAGSTPVNTTSNNMKNFKSSSSIINSYNKNKSSSNNIRRNLISNRGGRGYLHRNTSRGRSIFRFGGRGPATAARSKWVAIVRAVKQAYAASNLKYHADNSHNFNISIGGKSFSCRPDCSGFVSTCLKAFGVLNSTLSSYDFTSKSNAAMTASGFTPKSWTGWDNLSEGDIISRNGHVEIFAKNEDGKHFSYSGGSTTALNTNGPVQSSKDFTTVWSPDTASAANAITGDLGVDTSSVYTSTGTTTTGSSSSSSSGGSVISKVTSYLGNFFSEFSNRLLTGNTSTDYSNLLDDSSSSTDGGVSTDTSSTGAVASSVTTSSLQGNSNAEKIFKYFKGVGLSDGAAAGILGNIRAESGGNYNPTTVEQLFINHLTGKSGGKWAKSGNIYSDAGVDLSSAAKTYETYTDAINKKKISLDEFKHPYKTYVNKTGDSSYKSNKAKTGHEWLQYGYGLTQFTSPNLKEQLYNATVPKGISIGDLGAQLGVIHSQLQSIPALWTILSNPSVTPSEAAIAMLTKYEKPSNMGSTVQRTRANYAQDAYNSFGGRGTFNGSTYYSQNDGRWADNLYSNGDGGTMADSGCGPAAAAMAFSDATGYMIDPMQMANLAQATGNRDSSGTNWNFINDASDILGINSNQTINPSAGDIEAGLQSGNPVILSGMGGAGTPYTDAGHYVVAVGEDSNGNVIVNDPRGTSYSKKYNINDLVASTGSAWMIGGNGKGNKIASVKLNNGGKGIDLSLLNSKNITSNYSSTDSLNVADIKSITNANGSLDGAAMAKLIKSCIDILSSIADNTGNTSSKLDYLKNISASTNSGTSYGVVAGNSAGDVMNSSLQAKANSKTSQMELRARQIAAGGY